ncbi:MAG: hypothetical protein AAF901_11320 [Bacteroidota bacterium]
MNRVYTVCFVLASFFMACSSDDDNGPLIDVELLSGQWFRTAPLCPEQNNIVFNLDGTYIYTFSGNPCGNNDRDTVQTTGEYRLNGNNITFNQETLTIIQEGDQVSESTEDFNTLVSQRITVLTENELVIERRFSIDPIFQNWNFFRE